MKIKYPEAGAEKIVKKFAFKPKTLRAEQMIIWLSFYYVKLKFEPSYSHDYNYARKCYIEGGNYREEDLRGKWKIVKESSEEEMFLDSL